MKLLSKVFGNIFAFSSILVVGFMIPFISDSNKVKTIVFSSLIIYSTVLITATIAILFLIPSIEDIGGTLSIYIVAKRVSLGDFVQSIDALFILTWIMCIFNYLAIIMHFTLASFKKVINVKKETSMVYSFSAIIFVLSMLPRNSSDIVFFEGTVYKYSSIIFVYFISFAILICGYIKKKHEKGAKNLEETN